MGTEGAINLATVATTLAGIVTTFLLIRKQARKLQADTRLVGAETMATDISGAAQLSETALALMAAAKEQAKEARQNADVANDRATEAEGRIDAIEQRLNGYAEAARIHRLWDDSVVAQIKLLGGTVDPPPPLVDRDRHIG